MERIFTDEELKKLNVNDYIVETLEFLDGILDGENFNVIVSDTEFLTPEKKKPVIPSGMSIDIDLKINNDAKSFIITLHTLISLLITLNPMEIENEEIYNFKIAIITAAILSGTVTNSKNVKFSNVIFDKKYVQDNFKKLKKDEFEKNKKIINYINSANNFLAFSTINFVRFNHHFPHEKINLIKKSLSSLSEDIQSELLEERNMTTFYYELVTCAKIINDMKFYLKYIKKDEELSSDLKFNYYPILGIKKSNFEEDIIKIRSENTANGFLILDIVNEIVNDLYSKKLLSLVPYINQFTELLSIRETIRKNPFVYHPSRYFYKLGNEKYLKIKEKFDTCIRQVASFIFLYSDEMYESIKNAKCRDKYKNNLKHTDEILVNLLFKISNIEIKLSDDQIRLIKEKLKYEDFDISKLNDINATNELIFKQIHSMEKNN